MPNTLSVLFLVVGWVPLVISLRSLSPDPCDPKTQADPITLRSDQMTVLINGYAESRIPLLHSIAAAYSVSPSVASVLVLWGNPSTPAQTLTQLSQNLSVSSPGYAPISVVRQPSDSLNARFLPRPLITTRAVLICDDDVEIDPKSIEFAFKIWTSSRNRLVGFFARSHDIDLSRRTWIYTVHPDKYSIMLTKFMITKTESLYKYTCEGGKPMIKARAVVDQMRNCEDILMNFVAADEGNAGPVLVGAEKARDWGDARNEGRQRRRELEEEGVREVGLSSRRKDHRKRRGECIREFHRILGRMPLRYSYGKVVNSVGEQGLCVKGGRKHQIRARDDLEALLGERSGEFVSWLWDHLLKFAHQSSSAIGFDPKDVTFTSPSNNGADKDLRSNRLKDVQNHGNGNADSSLGHTSAHASSPDPSINVEHSEGIQDCKGLVEQSQKQRNTVPREASATENIHDDSLTHKPSRIVALL